jgi:hypothetical protein
MTLLTDIVIAVLIGFERLIHRLLGATPPGPKDCTLGDDEDLDWFDDDYAAHFEEHDLEQ